MVSKGTFQLPKASGPTTARAPAAKGAPAAGGAANVHKVQYDIAVKGAFHQLVRYLNLLEKEKRFLNIETFTIVKGSESQMKGKSVAQAVRELKIVVSSFTWRQGPTGAVQPAVVVAEEKGGQSTPPE